MDQQLSGKADNDFLVLRLNPLSEIKACGASILGGGAASITTEFLGVAAKLALVPASNLVVLGVAFTAVALPIYEAMERRAMEAGHWKIIKMKRPAIEID